MKPTQPKYLIKTGPWSPVERAVNTGEWPFTFGQWSMTFYPYVHDENGSVMWLDPYIEHNHLFVEQRVAWHYLLPEWNAIEGLYNETQKMPFCLHCGVFMGKSEWESFEKSKELVHLSVKDTHASI